MSTEEWIVMFYSPLEAPRAQQVVNDCLASLDGGGGGWWQVVRRRATSMPSDFALVRLWLTLPLQRTRAVAALQKHADVRLLTAERQYQLPASSSRRPVWHNDGGSGDSGDGDEDETQPAPLETLPRRRLLFPKLRRHPRLAGAARRQAQSIASRLRADALWRLGYSGKGVRVAVFDTGLTTGEAAHRLRHVVGQQTDWTGEGGAGDAVGHGTFVSGVIGASGGGCLGLAPEASLLIFKVFNSEQLSFTSWFLDAFNHILSGAAGEVHVINLSVGGPDTSDRAFMRKVDELAARGVVLISGIGNSGPSWGSNMNPADQPDVIGVGGLDEEGGIALFSSRGMTSWALPDGYGRVKPDVLALGTRVRGLGLDGGCRSLSGTSVACPVAAGAVALLASMLPEPRRWQVLNPAAVKQVRLLSRRV